MLRTSFRSSRATVGLHGSGNRFPEPSTASVNTSFPAVHPDNRALATRSPDYRARMFTGVLRYRSKDNRGYVAGNRDADEALARLLQARSLRPHQFTRDCEIGPFIVDHVCVEQALVIDLSRSRSEAEARCRFLEALGYRVLSVSRR